MKGLRTKIEIIGINPFVFIPNDVLNYIFEKAEKNKGKIQFVLKLKDTNLNRL